MLNPTIAAVSKYLHMYFEKGVCSGGINAARCALSLVLPHSQGPTIGKHFLVKWSCKGCHEQRPPQHRYDSSWNVQVVLDWLPDVIQGCRQEWAQEGPEGHYLAGGSC